MSVLLLFLIDIDMKMCLFVCFEKARPLTTCCPSSAGNLGLLSPAADLLDATTGRFLPASGEPLASPVAAADAIIRARLYRALYVPAAAGNHANLATGSDHAAASNHAAGSDHSGPRGVLGLCTLGAAPGTGRTVPIAACLGARWPALDDPQGDNEQKDHHRHHPLVDGPLFDPLSPLTGLEAGVLMRAMGVTDVVVVPLAGRSNLCASVVVGSSCV
jgi:hypothetical protein